jgi:hypothetical protein
MMPTEFRKLTPEIIESLLSESVCGSDINITNELRHFLNLAEHSELLRRVLEASIDAAKNQNRVVDACAVAMWLGFRAARACEQNEKLERLLK